MRRRGKIIIATIAGATMLLAGYETWRIREARAATPELVRNLLANVDPELDRLSRARIDMLLAVEDPTFWSNSGVDLWTPGAGGTTITQSLGKGLYFKPYRPYIDEPQLMLLSVFALTPRASKNDILKAFMGNAYQGYANGEAIVGFPAGARHWFGRELSALTDDEFLALVAMLPAPGRYRPGQDASAERVARIKRLLARECTPNDHLDVALQGCAAG